MSSKTLLTSFSIQQHL